MRNKMYDIPGDYVLSIFEMVFSFIVLIGLSFFSLYFLSKVVEVPPVPNKVVLESAFIYRDVSGGSKTTSNLYLRVGSGDVAYDHVIEASIRDIQYLDLKKSRKLWVAVEPDRSKRFVWGVYDDQLKLLISRNDIQGWLWHSNFVNYSIVATWGAMSLFMLFMLFKYGVWNRFLAKRITRENR